MKTRFLLIVSFLMLQMVSIAQEETKIVSKYDFISGEKIVFYDDFTSDLIGDFPIQWNTNSSGEIVTIGKYPGRWFQMKGGGYYIPEAKEKFTENFTVEFDLVPFNVNNLDYLYNMNFLFISGTLSNPNEGGAIPGKAGINITPGYDQIDWTNWSEKTEGFKDRGSASYQFKTDQNYHIAFWVQKQRIRMYANEKKLLDLPRGLIDGYIYNIFRIQTTDELIPLISNFRIATGLPDMRNKLITEGKLISYGIRFDINSDKLKPESTATIKEIAQVLIENPAVKVKIVGHTDSEGNDDSNMDLSKRRGRFVKKHYLKISALPMNEWKLMEKEYLNHWYQMTMQ